MKAVLQRVLNASCTVSGSVTGSIGHGLLVYFCAEQGDSEDMLEKFFSKIVSLRIFEDGNRKMNLPLADVGGGMLLISQFTLAADVSRGRRPSFDGAMGAEEAERFYEKAFEVLGKLGIHAERGVFGAHMEISYINDGPVTIIVDSDSIFHRKASETGV